MLLTPPDVFSQILLAIPMWMLFEVGVFFGRIVDKNNKQREEDEAKDA
jgi:sec-independent protein translocase protein TatC